MRTKYQELRVGYELDPVSKLITEEMSKDFSGWPHWKNLHTDNGIAKNLGFPGLVAQGALVACYISQMCAKFFGKDWFTHGKMKTQNKRPVILPQQITAKGVVVEIVEEPEGTKIDLEVWIENDAGEKFQTGTASCIVHERGA